MSQIVESQGALNNPVPPVSPMTLPVQVWLVVVPAAAGAFSLPL